MKLFIGIPTRGYIRSELVEWLLRQNYDYYLFSIDGFKDTNANKIIHSFLDTDATHLLLLDDDIEPDKDLIPRLTNYDKDVVAGTPVIFNRHEKQYKIGAFRKEIDGWYKLGNTGKLEEVDVIGGACILIKRKVLEKIKPPWFKIVIKKNGVDREGADVYFSKKVKQNKFELYADCSILLGHKNDVELKDTLDFAENYKNKD